VRDSDLVEPSVACQRALSRGRACHRKHSSQGLRVVE
jgi:hypothetical protein